MSRQIGSLNRSLSYPSNHQCHSPIISFSQFTPHLVPSYTNNSPRMDSDDPSINTSFHTISQFNNSDIKTPGEFAYSEPNSSTFSLPHFNHSIHKFPMSLPQSLLPTLMQTQFLSPMTSEPPDPSNPVDEELENDLDNFINLQQQLQNPNKLLIHHPSQTLTTSESSKLASATEETRGHRLFKRKHPNAKISSTPRPPRTVSVHALRTNTKEFLPCAYHFFHNTYYQTNTNNDQRLTLMNMPCFPYLHGPHIILSVAHYQFHYIITQTTMNCVTLDYIT